MEASWTIRIDKWCPISENEYRKNRHWIYANKKAKEATDMIGGYANLARVPRIERDEPEGYRPKRRIGLVVNLGGRRGRLPDPDNLLKPLLDSLRKLDLIYDDSAKWCEAKMPVITNDKTRPFETTITIEDI